MKKMILLFAISMVISACEKNSPEDLSEKIAGNYNGIFYQHSNRLL
jgi:hypothetical protein